MNRRLDGKRILPADITPDVYEGLSIVENIILASSNALRGFFTLLNDNLLPGPIPKFVTRKNPSLDNYFADLLLRTCYEPIDYMPAYEEHVIRGSQIELPSSLNPRLVGSILIGIGGMSDNKDFKKVYDEHASIQGTRIANSASDVVFQEHLACCRDHPGIHAIEPIRQEISYIDAHGGASLDHIFTVAKNLHIAQFRQPGFVSESLDSQWKRAIIDAVLASVCISVDSFKDYNNQAALASLEREWNLYMTKAEKLAQSGFVDALEPEAIAYVKGILLKPNITLIQGQPSYFTHRKMLFALQKTWHELVVSFVMGFLFESMLQAQQAFIQIQKKELPIHRLPGNFCLIYYQKEPLDKMPHRGILAKMNNERKKAIVIVHDPARQITSIFCNNYFPKELWINFCTCLVQEEGNDVWYIPKDSNGQIADFILNGTESFVGVDMTQLCENDYLDILKSTTKAATKK